MFPLAYVCRIRFERPKEDASIIDITFSRSTKAEANGRPSGDRTVMDSIPDIFPNYPSSNVVSSCNETRRF